MALKYGGDTVSTVKYGDEYVYFVKYGSTIVYRWTDWTSLSLNNAYSSSVTTYIRNLSNNIKYYRYAIRYSNSSSTVVGISSSYDPDGVGGYGGSTYRSYKTVSAGSNSGTVTRTISTYADRYVTGYFYECAVWQCKNSSNSNVNSVYTGTTGLVISSAYRSGNYSSDD